MKGQVRGRAPFVTVPLLAWLAAVPGAAAPQAAGGLFQPGTLRVSGQATVEVPADRVSVAFAVETEAPSAQEASRSNAARMDAVLQALRGASVPGLELETYGYTLRPEYRTGPQDPGARSIVAYRAVNHVRARIPDVAAAGRVLDLALGAGANRVANLSFEASDTRQARLEALRQAVARAREEAETIAQAMGVTLGGAVEVQGGASVPLPRSLDLARAEPLMVAFEGAPATPIEGGNLVVSASVSISYRIVERRR